MGEISKIKNKWIEWSKRTENLANLLMEMGYEKGVYESFTVEVKKLNGVIKWRG